MFSLRPIEVKFSLTRRGCGATHWGLGRNSRKPFASRPQNTQEKNQNESESLGARQNRRNPAEFMRGHIGA